MWLIFFIGSIFVLGNIPIAIRKNPKLSPDKKCLYCFIIFYIFIGIFLSCLQSIINDIIIKKYFSSSIYMLIVIKGILNIIITTLTLILSCKFSTACFNQQNMLSNSEFKKLQSQITIFIICMMVLFLTFDLITFAKNYSTAEKIYTGEFYSSVVGNVSQRRANLISKYSNYLNIDDKQFSDELSKIDGSNNLTNQELEKTLNSYAQKLKTILLNSMFINLLLTIPCEIILVFVSRKLLSIFYLKRLNN